MVGVAAVNCDFLFLLSLSVVLTLVSRYRHLTSPSVALSFCLLHRFRFCPSLIRYYPRLS